jgi:hypothetical protein
MCWIWWRLRLRLIFVAAPPGEGQTDHGQTDSGSPLFILARLEIVIAKSKKSLSRATLTSHPPPSRDNSYYYRTSLIMSLPEGAFPRLNASMVHSGAYTGSIASVVGKAISFDGEQTVELVCVDGGRVQIMTSPDFSFVPGMVVEIMGAVQEDRTIQVSCFIYFFSERWRLRALCIRVVYRLRHH